MLCTATDAASCGRASALPLAAARRSLRFIEQLTLKQLGLCTYSSAHLGEQVVNPIKHANPDDFSRGLTDCKDK